MAYQKSTKAVVEVDSFGEKTTEKALEVAEKVIKSVDSSTPDEVGWVDCSEHCEKYSEHIALEERTISCHVVSAYFPHD